MTPDKAGSKVSPLALRVLIETWSKTKARFAQSARETARPYKLRLCR